VAATASVAAPARPQFLPWAITGVAVVALAVVALNRPGGAGEASAPPASAVPFAAVGAAPEAGGGAPVGNARAVDLSSMTPREAADRLFNRVMENVGRGDTAQARAFLPMAISAYGRAGELDVDGRYHLGTLHLVGGDAAAARAQADTILAAQPNHLFGLFVAAEAERMRGNAAAAKPLFQRFLDGYTTESAKPLPEYQDHRQSFESMKEEAERAIR
jgi:hypothetical protein